MPWQGCKEAVVPHQHPGWGHLDSGKQRRGSALMYTYFEVPLALWVFWSWSRLVLNKDVVLLLLNLGDLHQKILPKSSLTEKFKTSEKSSAPSERSMGSRLQLFFHAFKIPILGLVSPCESVWDTFRGWPGWFNADIIKRTPDWALRSSTL